MDDPPPSERVDYLWTHETALPASDRGAEEWLRAAWEGGPLLLRRLLPIGWRFGLGLRLGPRGSEGHVLGWPITRTDRHTVVVAADSPFMHAKSCLRVQSRTIVWTTRISFTTQVGRVLWMPAQPAHQWLVPRLLARAAR